MGIVYLQNLPHGTNKEIEEAFKPFGRVTWTPLIREGEYSSGFCEFSTSEHAAQFAAFITGLPLKRRIVAKTDANITSDIKSVTSLPLNILIRRIKSALEAFNSKGDQIEEVVALDGTIGDEIEADLRSTVEHDILKFRVYVQSVLKSRQRTASQRVAKVILSNGSKAPAQKENLEEINSRFSELLEKYPEWDTKWTEFVDYAQKCLQEETKLRKMLTPSNLSANTYLKFAGIPPSVEKPTFISRRNAELKIERIVKEQMEAYKKQIELSEKPQVSPVTPAIQPTQVTEATSTTDPTSPESAPAVEPTSAETAPAEPAPTSATTVTLESLIIEYFGEADSDLIDFINESLPRGEEALKDGLKDLLLDETQAFVDKLMQLKR